MTEANPKPEPQPEPTPTAALEPLAASTALASGEDWNRELKRWQKMIDSRAMPKHVRTPEMAIAIVRMGDVYGWDPMRSLRSIYLVDGRPEMAAESMQSLVREKCPEATIVPQVMTARRVAIAVTRPPQMPEPVIFSTDVEQFKHLLKKDNWRNYPEDMLWARCVSRICRRVFPDVTAGAYTLGEIEEGGSVSQIGPEPMTFDDPPKVVEGELVDDDGEEIVFGPDGPDDFDDDDPTEHDRKCDEARDEKGDPSYAEERTAAFGEQQDWVEADSAGDEEAP